MGATRGKELTPVQLNVRISIKDVTRLKAIQDRLRLSTGLEPSQGDVVRMLIRGLTLATPIKK